LECPEGETEALTVRELSSTDDLSHYFLDETPEEDPPVFDKLYLVESTEICWKCKSAIPVFTFGCASSEKEDSFFVTAFVHTAPDDLIRAIKKRSQNYFLDYSKTANTTYYMNHCPRCNAKIGDFYMHYKPGNSFYPESKNDCSQIIIYEIEHDREKNLSCQCDLIPRPLIKKYAVSRQLSKKTIFSHLKNFFLKLLGAFSK